MVGLARQRTRVDGRARRAGAGRRRYRGGVLRSCAWAGRAVHDRRDRAAILRAGAAEHAGRADAGRPFHRGGTAGTAGSRQASRRARDLLHRAGARAGRHLVLRPCRADQYGKSGAGGLRGPEIARGPRRLSPRRGAAGLYRPYGRRAEGARPRCRRADALHRTRLRRGGAARNARPGGPVEYREPIHLRGFNPGARSETAKSPVGFWG